MPVYTKSAAVVFNPVTGAGAARGADMGDAQTWGTEVETAVQDIDNQFTTSLTLNNLTVGGALAAASATMSGNITANGGINTFLYGLTFTRGLTNVPPGDPSPTTNNNWILDTKTSVDYPVAKMEPTTANTVMAFDLIPNGTPAGVNGPMLSQAWMDIVNSGVGISNTLRMSNGASGAWISNLALGGAPDQPLYMGITITKYLTFDPATSEVIFNQPKQGPSNSTKSNVDYTLVLGDRLLRTRMSSTAVHNLTIPPNVFPVNCEIEVFQAGTGTVTIVAGLGVTFTGASTLTQNKKTTLWQQALNTWVVFG